MPTAVEVLHDDGRWYLAELLGQHRDRATGDWRCGVRYGVAPRMVYQRIVWADHCRALPPEQVDGQQGRPAEAEQARTAVQAARLRRGVSRAPTVAAPTVSGDRPNAARSESSQHCVRT